MSGEAFGIGSTFVLTQALREVNASQTLIARAQSHEFHDYLSPHAMPQHALLTALQGERPDVREKITPRILAGDFDGTLAESEAWARSPEGQAAFAMLLPGRKDER